MSERGKRVFRFLLDPERDADVIRRIEARPSMTGYVRELVRRDKHEHDMRDELLDFAALKASELQAENAKLHAELTDLRLGSCPSCGIKVENERLREMCRDLVGELRGLGIDFTRVSWCEYADELRELGIEVEGCE